MKRPVFVTIMLAAALAFSGPGAWADTAYTAWLPTDGNIQCISLNFLTGSSYDVYLYDYGDTDSSLLVMNKNATGNTVYILQDIDNGIWYASYDNIIETGIDLTLGNTAHFGLYFQDGSPEFTYSYTPYTAGTYLLSVGSPEPNYLLGDATPIPIPPTAFLLGTGLVGLLVLARRRKDK